MDDNVTPQPSALPHSTESIGLRDTSMRLLLLLVFVLQLLSWGNLDGYQLADSVEYMERAQALVRGEEVIDSVAIRSFGFVSLFAPIFALADVFGVEDFNPVVGVVRLLQMLLGLALIHVTVCLGNKLGGRRAGLAAGLVVGLNPYFLLYSASPVSGIAAAVCIGHALNRLLFRASYRDGLIGGLWLGGALLVAYKTILLALPILGLVLLADRFARAQSWIGATTGYVIGVLGAIGLDKLCYGVWGKSVDLYFRQNFGQLGTRLSLRFGFPDLATWFWNYTGGESSHWVEAPRTIPRELTHGPNTFYHLIHLNEMVALPLLALGLFALIRIVLRGNRPTRILSLVFLVSLAAVSLKKSSDFRLLLPSLSCIGVLCGLGWQWLFGNRAHQRPMLLLGALVIAAGGVLGWLRLGELNDARFSGYWRAMNRVNQLASETAEERADGQAYRVACAWHWAVFLRESAEVDLIKLPHQIDRWQSFDEDYRADNLEVIASLDAFITHIAVLLGSPDLMAAVNERFEVDAVLYNREIFGSLGPVIIFKERSGSKQALTFMSRSIEPDLASYVKRHDLNPGRSFGVTDAPEAGAALELVGWKYEGLPGDGHGWLSLHWRRPASSTVSSFLVRPRFLTRLVELPWEEQHLLGRSSYPPSDWRENEIVSEGWPVVAAVAPFDWTREWQPLYANQAPGTTFPASFWLRITPLGENVTAGAALLPIRASESTDAPPLSDGFVLMDKFELIVPPGAR